MIFRQFRAPDRQLSYLFADPVTRQAAVLDSHFQLEQEYLAVMRHLDLELAFVIETHAHESHLSAAPMLFRETGATWITSAQVDTGGVAQTVRNRECIYIGEECFAALETPGHSVCSMCFRWRDRVFTGHTLLAGTAGPCNRPDSDADRLYDSIVGCLYALPGSTLVFPGLDCGLRQSTVAREREYNNELNPGTAREDFIRRKGSDDPPREWTVRRPAGSHPVDLYPFR